MKQETSSQTINSRDQANQVKPSTVVTREVDYSGLFRLLEDAKVNDVLGFVNPHPDGNCGYRVVSLAVFDNEIAWIQVKKMMLATFTKYANTIFNTYGLNEAYTSKKSQSTKAPCLDDLSLWFDCYGCPQIVANTFNRLVILHATTPKVDKYDITWGENDGNVMYIKSTITFVPLFGLDLETMNNLIQLLFDNSLFI
ncbi:hypothetical protein INT47_003750 [Mucor saturninus]|uniref:OTU domain-containing protein n=1 Tax=Mucor saturninus TaxID=64648 RepID=A0A8H7RAK8_9FUNG|nr:hypothetical protein INT47_003750 [Mucor saturninus]